MGGLKKVTFYNHFHNGDLHLSREFVRQIINMFPDIEFTYTHLNKPDVLSDLNAKHDPEVKRFRRETHYKIDGDQAFINTWYGAGNQKYLVKYGISFDCLYYSFKDIYADVFNVDIDKFQAKDLLPTIDFSGYKTDGVDDFIKQHPDTKKVLISNGEVQSGQTVNFPMIPIANNLAKNNKDVMFLVTNKEKGGKLSKLDNLIYTFDIINKKSGSDLNENAYLSTKCDTIVGRGSGTYMFAYIQDNLVNRKTKFVCFKKKGHRYKHANWVRKDFANMPYTCSFIDSPATRSKDVQNIIQQQINK